MTRPFRVERRPLPPTSGKSPLVPSPYTTAEIRTAGLRAVAAELDPRPIADDVARLTRRGWFARDLVATEAGAF